MICFHPRILSLTILSLLIGQWTVICIGFFGNHGNDGKCPPIKSEEVENLFKKFRNIEEDRNALERKLINEGKVVIPQNPSDAKIADLSRNRQPQRDPLTRHNELKQIVFEAVTDALTEKYHLTPDQVINCLPNVSLSGEYGSKAKAECQATLFSDHCDANAPYRTADGTCTNLKNPTWGSVGNCFPTILPPRYDSGSAGFRQSVKGGPLPPPRKLSLNVHAHLDRPTQDITHMFMFFGQIIDHEITQAPFTSTLDNLAIKCCVEGESHPQCTTIQISPKDPFYKDTGRTCISVARSSLCPYCKLGPRKQFNQITSVIDGSVMYGTNAKETASLRTHDGTGRMSVQKTPVGDLLPPIPKPEEDQCSLSFADINQTCFHAGDPRANEHPPLSSLQTLLVREHNRLADGLKKLNPSWDGEKIFQETRRIIYAQFQNMIYSEFLPIALGEKKLDEYRLRVSSTGRTEYEPTTDPSIRSEFTNAAFRFGHSLINSVLANYPINSTAAGTPSMLRDLFFQGFQLRKGILSEVMIGVTKSPAQSFDRHLVPDVTNFLYRIRTKPDGLDLPSINIHRGREVGLPSYADMARHCSGMKLKRFRHFVDNNVISSKNARLLARNYKSVEDIDLWTGMLSEKHLEGAIVGPTAACIIGQQFEDIKFGDRFYFTHKNQIGSFTYPQIEEIKQMTLTKLICLNTDVDVLQKNALLYTSDDNPLLKCSSLKGVNLSLWKEEK